MMRRSFCFWLMSGAIACAATEPPPAERAWTGRSQPRTGRLCAQLEAELRPLQTAGRLERAARLLSAGRGRADCDPASATHALLGILAELGDVAAIDRLRRKLKRDPGTTPKLLAAGASAAQTARARATESAEALVEGGEFALSRGDRAAARRFFDRALVRLEADAAELGLSPAQVSAAPIPRLSPWASDLAWAPDGSRIAVVDGAQLIVYELGSGKAQGVLEPQYVMGLRATGRAVVWPSRDRLVVGTEDGNLTSYDATTTAVVAHQRVAPIVRRGLAALAQRGWVVAAHEDDTVSLLRLASLAPERRLPAAGRLSCVAAAVAGDVIAIGRQEAVSVLRVVAGSPAELVPLDQVTVTTKSVAVSRDGTRVAWSGPDGAGVRELGAKVTHQTSGHRDLVAFSPDGSQVLSTSGPVVYADLGDAEPPKWRPRGRWVDDLEIGPAGSVATVGDRSLRIHDATGDERRWTAMRYEGGPAAACRAAGALVLPSGVVWWPRSGRTARPGSSGWLGAVDCSSDSNWLIAGEGTPPAFGLYQITEDGLSPVRKVPMPIAGGWVQWGRLTVGPEGRYAAAHRRRLITGGAGGADEPERLLPRRANDIGVSSQATLVADDAGWLLFTPGVATPRRWTTPAAVNRLVVRGDGERLALGLANGSIEFRSLANDLISRWQPSHKEIRALALAPNGNHVGWVDAEGNLGICGESAWPACRRLPTRGSRVRSLAYLTARWLLVASRSDRIRVVSTRDGSVGLTLFPLGDGSAFALSPGPSPAVQIVGDSARQALWCGVGSRWFGFELCRDRAEQPQLVARLLRQP